MFSFTPSRTAGDAGRNVAQLLNPRPDPALFSVRIKRLREMFASCCAHCPPPFADHDLHVTPEIQYQSEQWLPLDEVRRHFHQLYRHLLNYPPLFSSTPFATATSWARIVSCFSAFCKNVANPADLFERVLLDDELRVKFLFWSFMPDRYYGAGIDRYPAQSAVIAEWLQRRGDQEGRIRCLDAACGDGVASYGLARMLLEQGIDPDRFRIEGWTLEPLEAWAAAHGLFPHNPVHEAAFRSVTGPVFRQAACDSLRFSSVDLLDAGAADLERRELAYDLIVCNGLLGGPIIHHREQLQRIAGRLVRGLAADGMLLVADHFHGGWKKKIPGEFLGDLFRAYGLIVRPAGEGFAALSPVGS